MPRFGELLGQTLTKLQQGNRIAPAEIATLQAQANAMEDNARRAEGLEVSGGNVEVGSGGTGDLLANFANLKFLPDMGTILVGSATTSSGGWETITWTEITSRGAGGVLSILPSSEIGWAGSSGRLLTKTRIARDKSVVLVGSVSFAGTTGTTSTAGTRLVNIVGYDTDSNTGIEQLVKFTAQSSYTGGQGASTHQKAPFIFKVFGYDSSGPNIPSIETGSVVFKIWATQNSGGSMTCEIEMAALAIA